MASLWKHPKSRFWTACFTAGDGRQLKRSTKTTDRKTALAIAEKLEQAWRKKATETQARRIIQEIYQAVHGEHLDSSGVAEFFNRWLGRKKMETKPRTFEKYEIVCRKFLEFLPDAKRAGELANLNAKDIAAYRDHCGTTLSPGTANGELKILRSVLGEAVREGIIEQNPATRVGLIKREVQQVKRRAFTLDEIRAILANCDTEWKGLVLFGLYTGQRLKDIACLTRQNLDLENGLLHLVTGKTGRQQIIPLAEPLLRYICKHTSKDADRRAPLFPRANGYVVRSNAGRASVLSEQFYNILAKVGLVEARTHQGSKSGRSARRELNDVSFHCLRHTATSLMKNAGVSPAVVQDVIGHDSAAISANYTHIEDATKREAVNKIPDVTATGTAARH